MWRCDPIHRTSSFTYTKGNQLLTETAPWANSTLTNKYVNRLRTGLSLKGVNP